VKETDDGKRVGVSDVGSIPTTSTKSDDWYYTENQWARLGMLGPLPPERNKQLLTNEYGGDMASTGRVEILQEGSDTKHKRQR
jgi:hypothetical protein